MLLLLQGICLHWGSERQGSKTEEMPTILEAQSPFDLSSDIKQHLPKQTWLRVAAIWSWCLLNSHYMPGVAVVDGLFRLSASPWHICDMEHIVSIARWLLCLSEGRPIAGSPSHVTVDFETDQKNAGLCPIRSEVPLLLTLPRR